MKKLFCFLIACSLILFNTSFAYTFKPNTNYQVCFTPNKKCVRLLVHYINQAKKSIYMQAYFFTSYTIAHALVNAAKRGVKVNIILDNSNFTGNTKTEMYYLKNNHIPLWNDHKLNIAHNKVMIIDKSIVETGSFNFTNAAVYYNAENLLFINSSNLAKLYLVNWFKREKQSIRID